MTTLKQIADGRTDLYMVDPALLTIVAEDDFRSEASITENVEWLKQSIRENGFDRTQPITVQVNGDVYEIDDGRCRLRAVIELIAEGVEIKAIPVIPEERYAAKEERLFRSFTRNTGKQFTPVEQSRLFKKLHTLGWKPADIARRSAKSLPHVLNMLELSAADSSVIEAVEQGEISATTAVQVIKEIGHEAASEVIAEAVEAAKEEGKSKASITDVRETMNDRQEAASNTEVTPQRKSPSKKVAAEMVERMYRTIKLLVQSSEEGDKAAMAATFDELKAYLDEVKAQGFEVE